MNMQQLLQMVVDQNASDLHLIADSPPVLRVDGNLVGVQNEPPLTAESISELLKTLLTQEQKDLFKVNKEVDFSYQFKDLGRFRVNVYFQKGKPSAALRLIPNQIRTIEELQLPQICHDITQMRQGLVLVTGPTGEGKSTSLAAMIQEINQTRSEHILTIEDPIEFVYQPVKSIISQRELHQDTHSWEVALKSALREDPDVVLVGEMRDFETISAAITVAETGHLVFATLHTNSAAQTIDRIIDVFPEHQQSQVRQQLASSIQAVLSQRLVPSQSGGRVAAFEVLMATPAVQNLIREGKTFQIDNVIQTSAEVGMTSLEASLVRWMRAGVITKDVARTYSIRPDEFDRLAGR